MDIKGLNVGDIRQWATQDLADRLTAILNAKSNRRKPYWILITFDSQYKGPLAFGNNNYLLHGIDKKEKRSLGEIKEVDMSEKRTVHQKIEILERHHLPPVALIGTALFYVNNQSGLFEKVYILPPDIPGIELGNELESETVGKNSQGMPIIYGVN